MSSSGNRLFAIIPDWLAITRGVEVPTGLPRDEALRRARELLDTLRDGRRPTLMELNEDSKDVLHASVELLGATEPDARETVLETANRLYHHIEDISWADDLFEEKRGLLRSCAETGWATLGLTLAGVNGHRIAVASEALNDDRAYPDRFHILREMWETAPSTVAADAARLYDSIESGGRANGLFDEYDYLLGETALIAGTAQRIIGKLEEAERWLDRAESAFRHTLDPAPLLANLSYARLALQYVVGRYGDVLELLPALVTSFQKIGMELEADKSRFLGVKTMMQLGRNEESLDVLASLRKSEAVRQNPTLLGHVLVHAGNCLGSLARFEEASEAYAEALPVVQRSSPSPGLAELKFSIGDTYREQNDAVKALQAYRAAQNDFVSLEMPTYVAVLHLVIAEVLLSLGQHPEAEQEIHAALPTIEELKMVPEGLAAVALLRESVRHRNTDPRALRDLRDHLQGKV